MLRSRGAKRARLIAEECRHSPGCSISALQANTGFCALSNLGINPGGDVMCQGPISRKDLHRVPTALRNRLLTQTEVRRHLDGKQVSE